MVSSVLQPLGTLLLLLLLIPVEYLCLLLLRVAAPPHCPCPCCSSSSSSSSSRRLRFLRRKDFIESSTRSYICLSIEVLCINNFINNTRDLPLLHLLQTAEVAVPLIRNSI